MTTKTKPKTQDKEPKIKGATLGQFSQMLIYCSEKHFHRGVIQQAISISRYDHESALRYLTFYETKQNDLDYLNRRMGVSNCNLISTF